MKCLTFCLSGTEVPAEHMVCQLCSEDMFHFTHPRVVEYKIHRLQDKIEDFTLAVGTLPTPRGHVHSIPLSGVLWRVSSRSCAVSCRSRGQEGEDPYSPAESGGLWGHL